MLCKYSNFTSLKENIGQTFLPGRKVWRNLSLQKGKLDRNSTDTQMSWCRSACADCRVLTPDKQVSRGDICLHNMCCTAKLFWFYYGSRISPITLIFLLRALATRRWRSLRIPWALHAHLAICPQRARSEIREHRLYTTQVSDSARSRPNSKLEYTIRPTNKQ